MPPSAPKRAASPKPSRPGSAATKAALSTKGSATNNEVVPALGVASPLTLVVAVASVAAGFAAGRSSCAAAIKEQHSDIVDGSHGTEPGSDSFDWGTHSNATCHPAAIRLQLGGDELRTGQLTLKHQQQALAAFASCGVVVIENAMDSEGVEAFRAGLAVRMREHLASRSRVRAALKRAMVHRHSLKQLWTDGASVPGMRLSDELIFADGHTFRERNAGRIDVQLPYDEPPFGGLTHNPFASSMLRELLGSEHKLHSVHAVVSLPGEARNQHWHRDTALLFGARTDGTARVPPYAINAFVPLVPQHASLGPTQFALGSHLFGGEIAPEAGLPERDYPPVSFEVGAGALILCDYRTAHRGLENSSPRESRPVAMLVYSRRWWSDSENYGGANVGGFGPRRRFDPDSDEGRRETLLQPLAQQAEVSSDEARAAAAADHGRTLYFGLVNRWEASLVRELDAGNFE